MIRLSTRPLPSITGTGYPISRAKIHLSKRSAEFKPLALTAVPAERSDYELLKLSDQSHVVLEFDQKKTSLAADSNAIAPSPIGVSGGGIWTLGESFTPDGADAKLAAIATRWPHRKAKAIVGTRVSDHYDVIRDRWPHVGSFLPISRLTIAAGRGPARTRLRQTCSARNRNRLIAVKRRPPTSSGIRQSVATQMK